MKPEFMQWKEHLLEKIYQNGIAWDGKFAHVGIHPCGAYRINDGGMWTDSFWVGIFYLAYLWTKDEKYLKIADKYQPYYEKRAYDDSSLLNIPEFVKLDHDTGFIFILSEVARYKLTGEEQARKLALHAADVLFGRFVKEGGFIRAFDPWSWETDEEKIREKKGLFIIDSMMNIPLLFWAAEETGVNAYREAAEQHAKTVLQYIVREDGSTFHAFLMDPDTYKPVKGRTGQGYADHTCWSRGQAWAIYGFTIAYRYTHKSEFLNAAVKTARYFIEHLNGYQMAAWDFAAQENIFCPWDSSAMAIAASGMAELAAVADMPDMKENAVVLLKSLHQFCDVVSVKSLQPLLLHGCVGAAYHEGNELQLAMPYIDVPTPYGDYFYMEAILKLEMNNFVLFW